MISVTQRSVDRSTDERAATENAFEKMETLQERATTLSERLSAFETGRTGPQSTDTGESPD